MHLRARENALFATPCQTSDSRQNYRAKTHNITVMLTLAAAQSVSSVCRRWYRLLIIVHAARRRICLAACSKPTASQASPMSCGTWWKAKWLVLAHKLPPKEPQK
jgi:hypothetical protein